MNCYKFASYGILYIFLFGLILGASCIPILIIGIYFYPETFESILNIYLSICCLIPGIIIIIDEKKK